MENEKAFFFHIWSSLHFLEGVFQKSVGLPSDLQFHVLILLTKMSWGGVMTFVPFVLTLEAFTQLSSGFAFVCDFFQECFALEISQSVRYD